MLIIETPGKKGQFKARIVGVIVFGEPFAYQSKEDFYKDRKKHLIDEESRDFTWESGNGKCKWGWPIRTCKHLNKPLITTQKRGIVFTKTIPLV